MSKFKKFLIWIGSFTILGFIMSALMHSGYWKVLMDGFKAIPFYMYFIYIIAAFFLVILIHELGHLISFVVRGIKIRALYALIFVVKKTKKGWRLQIYFPLIKILGGLVVPDLPIITNDEEYDKVVDKFSIALLAGPLASIIYLVLSLTTFFLVWFLKGNSYLLGVLAINAIIVSLLTFVVMLASSVSTDTMYGDFVAYRKIKDDEEFQLTQIMQYVSFSLKDHTESNKYFIKRMETYYQAKRPGYSLFELTILMQYISLVIKEEDYIEKDYITKKINRLNIPRLARSKHGLEVSYLIAAYHYNFNNVEKAYEIYNTIYSNINNHHEKEIIEFYKLQYAHYLNLEDHTFYFKNIENLYFGDLWLLKPILDEEELLDELLEKLPFKEYYTQLYSKIDDKPK